MIRPSAIVTAFRNGGLDEVGWRMWHQTRDFTPVVGRTHYNGIPTGTETRLLDLVVKRWWTSEVRSNVLYESALVAGLRAHVRAGDRVVVVGGGHGVTAAVAALSAGREGHVDVFEAGDDMLPKIRRTLAATGVEATVTLHHAIVGAAHGVYGDTTAAVVAAGDLPPCDVLMMDCEGAEREILTDLIPSEARPRVLLVETHGVFGASTVAIRALAEGLGYTVVRAEVAESGQAERCRQDDIHVLTALRDDPRLEAPTP